MKTLEFKKQEILEAMITLIQEGETIATGHDGDFREFAEVNNFDLELVKEVFKENKEILEEIYNEK